MAGVMCDQTGCHGQRRESNASGRGIGNRAIEATNGQLAVDDSRSNKLAHLMTAFAFRGVERTRIPGVGFYRGLPKLQQVRQ